MDFAGTLVTLSLIPSPRSFFAKVDETKAVSLPVPRLIGRLTLLGLLGRSCAASTGTALATGAARHVAALTRLGSLGRLGGLGHGDLLAFGRLGAASGIATSHLAAAGFAFGRVAACLLLGGRERCRETECEHEAREYG